MRKLGRIIECAVSVIGHFSGWILVPMILIILYEVFMRYLLNRPPIIADEFSAYMFVALSFLGMAYTWKERGHVRIDVLTKKMPKRASSWIRLITYVFALGFAIFLSQLAYVYVATSFARHEHSGSWLRMPLQGPQMTLLIGFILLSLMLVVDVVKAIIDIRQGINIEDKN